MAHYGMAQFVPRAIICRSMQQITFTVPGRPQPKQRPRLARNGRAYTPQATQDYEYRVAEAGLTALDGLEWPTNLQYRLVVDFYLKTAGRADVDNLVKSLCDGLNGVAYDDDNLVVELTARKRIDRTNPRAEVTVTILGALCDLDA